VATHIRLLAGADFTRTLRRALSLRVARVDHRGLPDRPQGRGESIPSRVRPDYALGTVLERRQWHLTSLTRACVDTLPPGLHQAVTMLMSSSYLPRFQVDPPAATFYRLLHLANGLRVDRTGKAEKVSTWNPFGYSHDEAMDELGCLHLHRRGKLFEIVQDLLFYRVVDHYLAFSCAVRRKDCNFLRCQRR
jgi:hypothetical protein